MFEKSCVKKVTARASHSKRTRFTEYAFVSKYFPPHTSDRIINFSENMHLRMIFKMKTCIPTVMPLSNVTERQIYSHRDVRNIL
jgi:hypothetical protein